MSGLELVFLSLGFLYVIVFGWLYVGVVRSQRATAKSTVPAVRIGDLPSVSVVVAARDEEALIADCLRALLEQRYEGDLQVVVVDDRSSDRTGDIISLMANEHPQLKLVKAASALRFKCPKKSALAQGIEASSGELLLLTDADCAPPPDWVAATVARFAVPETGVVAGYARPRQPQTLREGLLALDNATIGALSAGSIGMGSPLACTGRNLAYRRRVYEETGGFEAIGHLVGGDDVYFVRHVAAVTSWQIVYNCCQAIVECATDPVGISAVINQKLRHASKAGHYTGAARFVGAVAYVFHALLLVAVSQLLLQAANWSGSLCCYSCLQLTLNAAILVWGAKIGVDLTVVWRFLRPGAERSLLWYLPLLEIVYIPYVLLFVPLGGMGWFRWKAGGPDE